MARWLNRFLGFFGEGFGAAQLPAGVRLKHLLLQKVLGVNRHVPWPVHWTSQVKEVERIQRGTRFPGLSANVYLDGRNGIAFGKNVWIGPRVSLISMNHNECDYEDYVEESPIVIGDNCWLGTNVVVLPGVKLGSHVIVAAGAVVTHSFEQDDILIAGVPAKIVKTLPPYTTDTK